MGSWDDRATRLKTGIDSRWRDLRFECTNIGKSLFLAYVPLWCSSSQFNVDESFGNWKTSDQMTGHEKRGGRGKGWMDRLEEPTEVKESEINGHMLHKRGVLEWVDWGPQRLLPNSFSTISKTHLLTKKKYIYFETNKLHYYSRWHGQLLKEHYEPLSQTDTFQNISMHSAYMSVCLRGHNKSVWEGFLDSYLESIKASLQIRPVLVFLASGSVELAPPVHELLFLLVT